jgi:Spy/CpxP family protein refolding chaperone
MQQAEKIGALETDLQKQRLHTMLRIRALLTPEQRDELVKIHEERRGRHRRGMPEEPVDSPDAEAPNPTGPPPTPGA